MLPTRRWTLGLGLFCVVLGMLLSACVSERRDVVTDSDQTDAQRRARVRLELASAYFGRGNKTTALDEVKQAIVADPNSHEAYNLRGLIYASMDQVELADESFRKAVQLNPQDGDAMHNHGWFLCQKRRYAEADALFRQAAAAPGYSGVSRTYLAQGVCQARSGRMHEAEKTLSHSYELDPSNPTTAVNLSEVLYRLGEYERARFYIRRVNNQDEQVSAQTLWLAARIERKMGQTVMMNSLGSQLRNRFPKAPETLMFEKGRFDD